MNNLKILDDFKFSCEFPVTWIDMDLLGHVNSSKYFTYIETARIKYYENLNFLEYFKVNNISGIVAKTECSYLIPLKYPDTITVGARITELTEYDFIMEYFVKSCSVGLAAIGEAEIVIFDFNKNQKIPIPNNIVDKIMQFENLNIKT